MTRPTRRRVLKGAGFIAAGLAGCTTSSGGGTTQPPTAPPTTTPDRPVAVGATCSSSGADFRFTPAITEMAVGDTVRWSGASHCKQQSLAYHPDNDRPLRIPQAADSWTSPVLTEGDAFKHTFEVAGVYNYLGLYEEFGQVGIVIVGDPAPDPAEEPGLEPPQEDIPADARSALEALISEAFAALS